MAKRILVVEDDPLNRMLLSTVLTQNGFEIVEVSDGAMVLANVRKFAPDLITMDINLPSISGLELIRLIRKDQELRNIPILAVTAYVGRGEDQAIRDAGANDVLTKPLSIQPFMARVSSLLS